MSNFTKSDSQIENGEMLVLSAAVLCCLNTGFVFLNYLFNSEVGFPRSEFEPGQSHESRITSRGPRTAYYSMKTEKSVINIQYCRLYIFV